MRRCIIPIAAHRPTRLRRRERLPYCFNFLTQRDQVLWDGPPPLSGTGRLPVLIPRTRRSGAMRIVVLGIDLGKNLCSLAGLDETGAVILRRRMKRASVLPFTAQLETCTVAMEACCGAHHLGRQLVAQGHVVRLMSPAYVQPYVNAQKNDERDAEAATRPTMR